MVGQVLSHAQLCQGGGVARHLCVISEGTLDVVCEQIWNGQLLISGFSTLALPALQVSFMPANCGFEVLFEKRSVVVRNAVFSWRDWCSGRAVSISFISHWYRPDVCFAGACTLIVNSRTCQLKWIFRASTVLLLPSRSHLGDTRARPFITSASRRKDRREALRNVTAQVEHFRDGHRLERAVPPAVDDKRW